jgi:hypothetical protein
MVIKHNLRIFIRRQFDTGSIVSGIFTFGINIYYLSVSFVFEQKTLCTVGNDLLQKIEYSNIS